MATLHLPKKRPVSSKEEPIRKVARDLDDNLEESLAGNDPATANEPSSTEEALFRRTEKAAK
jgi:hypothetical protein